MGDFPALLGLEHRRGQRSEGNCGIHATDLQKLLCMRRENMAKTGRFRLIATLECLITAAFGAAGKREMKWRQGVLFRLCSASASWSAVACNQRSNRRRKATSPRAKRSFSRQRLMG